VNELCHGSAHRCRSHCNTNIAALISRTAIIFSAVFRMSGRALNPMKNNVKNIRPYMATHVMFSRPVVQAIGRRAIRCTCSHAMQFEASKAVAAAAIAAAKALATTDQYGRVIVTESRKFAGQNIQVAITKFRHVLSIFGSPHENNFCPKP
jgi:hypothetical protein